MTETYVYLKEIRFYAFHGVLPQEQLVGGEFMVSLRVAYPFEAAMESDDVNDTLNYAELYALVKEQMDIPSRLLEHVAGRIVKAIQMQYPQVTRIELKITKKNPPMGADCEGAGVEVIWKIEH